MIHDIQKIQSFYSGLGAAVNKARNTLKRPLTYTEKIIFAHLFEPSTLKDFTRGTDYADFRPDRVAMQDATAQMALLQFMNAGKTHVAVPATIHCDHLVRAYKGAEEDLKQATEENGEVYSFLSSAAKRYGIGFWRPGSGIIHQVVLENYAFPAGMMVGTDSHTQNAGGLGMMAIGVGGADAVDVMTAMPWELKIPNLIGVRLTGKLSGWASPKDVILTLTGMLTVKGATNAVIEYFGEGAASLSATGKATICNMGAEMGATTSLFPYDEQMAAYLTATGRKEVADLASQNSENLKADAEVEANPENFYDRVITIDLSTLEPHLNGPFTPDAACEVSKMRRRIKENDYPEKVEAALIGSCTNSSYQDLTRAADVARQALATGVKIKAPLFIITGSIRVNATAERDGLLNVFRQLGATILANACGPCIGQWKRVTDDPTRRNSIVTTFNRNFAKRADGNPNTYAFIASPEMAMAYALSGDLGFNPLTDSLTDESGAAVKLLPPAGECLPPTGFAETDDGYTAPEDDAPEVVINPTSERLQLLQPFAPWDGKDFESLPMLIKAKGKCTTDHISMAGPWLRFRGHLENISQNMLMGAVNAFNEKTNCTLNQITKEYTAVSDAARYYKQQGLGSIVVAEENYGEGSSREHAAMEPRFLNVRVILAKSFARIHETNLKKQGMLALTFINKNNYDLVREDDRISVEGLADFAPGKPLKVILEHSDGSKDGFAVSHTYNEQQISWFQHGSALNAISHNE